MMMVKKSMEEQNRKIVEYECVCVCVCVCVRAVADLGILKEGFLCACALRGMSMLAK